MSRWVCHVKEGVFVKAHQAYLKTRQVIKKKKLIKFEILDDKLRLVRYLDSITSKFAFVQAFCTSLNDNTYGTKYALSVNTVVLCSHVAHCLF